MDNLRLFKQIAKPEYEDANSYWSTFLKLKHVDPNHLNTLASYERALNSLDSHSWALIRPRAIRLSTKLDSIGRYKEFFELLNEVKGYAYLKGLGCENVAFLPTSSERNTKTPDLFAVKHGEQYLCEVKTKNTSNDYEQKVRDSRVIRTGSELSEQLLESVNATIAKAYQQLSTYSSSHHIKIIYLCINYDNEGVDYRLRNKYNCQIQKSFEDMGLKDVILQIDDFCL